VELEIRLCGTTESLEDLLGMPHGNFTRFRRHEFFKAVQHMSQSVRLEDSEHLPLHFSRTVMEMAGRKFGVESGNHFVGKLHIFPAAGVQCRENPEHLTVRRSELFHLSSAINIDVVVNAFPHFRIEKLAPCFLLPEICYCHKLSFFQRNLKLTTEIWRHE
jgi:hypothetical protein